MNTLFFWLLAGVAVAVLEFELPINLALSFAAGLVLSPSTPISSNLGFVIAVSGLSLMRSDADVSPLG